MRVFRIEIPKRRARGAVAALAVLLALAAPAHAQDSNYWSSAYGTRASLLGGVVIGSPGDISSVYYNPGALALTTQSEFLLSGNAYQYMRVNVENGSGPGKPLVSGSLAAVPSLLAGEVPLLATDRLAYSFLTRQALDLEIDQHTALGAGTVAPFAGASFAAVELGFHQHVNENWVGMTWAHLLTSRLGLGVSPYLAVRSQETDVALFAVGATPGDSAAVLNQHRAFSYIHWRLLARIGLSGVRDSLTYGITLTTPSLGLLGGGEARQNLTLVDQTGKLGTITGASYQKDVKADYRSPLGLGAGASYAIANSRLHGAVEWMAEVPEYTVLDAAAFTVKSPTSDSTVALAVNEKLSDVFNWGVGFEHRFSPGLSGYVSYHTDRSARAHGQPVGASFTSWDLQHIAAGTTFRYLRSDFAVGVSTAFASQPVPPLPPRPDGRPTPDNLETHELLFTASLGWKIAF